MMLQEHLYSYRRTCNSGLHRVVHMCAQETKAASANKDIYWPAVGLMLANPTIGATAEADLATLKAQV